MLSCHPFSPQACIRISGGSSHLPDALESDVESLWKSEQERRGKALFNGKILSAIDVSRDVILGRVVEYRYLIAQRARPELYDVLQVRPVAVSGLFKCTDGVVFGRRTGTVTQEARLWELVPSGGLNTSNLASGEEVDYRAQILIELHEEIGVDSDSVSSVTPFCLVDDLHSHVLDIGIAIMSTLSADEVLRIHREAASKEYDELRVISLAEVEGFTQSETSQLVGVSTTLINQFLSMRGRLLGFGIEVQT